GFGIPRFRQVEIPGPIDELLRSPSSSQVNVAVQLNPWDLAAAAERAVRVARIGYNPGRDVSLPHFRGVLRQGPNITRSIFAERTIGGQGSRSLGGVSLGAADGRLDDYSGLSFDAR